MDKKSELEYQKLELEIKKDKMKWVSRRRMAWTSMIWLIIMTSYMFHFMSIEQIEALTGIIAWIYIVFASIPLGYLGLATWDQIHQSRR